MGLSDELISQFAKITNDKTRKSKESTSNGTIVEYNGRKYVRLDGSEFLTPITTMASVDDGDRVSVSIKNHTATVVGNTTSPSAKASTVETIGKQISDFEIILADKVDVTELNAQTARIDNLVADNVTIKETLTANNADITELQADNVTIRDTLAVNTADIDNLKAENAEITGKLDVASADIESLQADNVLIRDELVATNARIDNITATDITTEYLEANYAQINFINVDTATIRQGFLENLMVSQGIIADRVVGSEIVATDVLTGVKLYADDIVAGTLSVERLILRGSEDSLVYALNNSGGLESTVVDTLNGALITERTITADRIVVGSITSTEIDVKNLISTGFIDANKLTAKNVDVSDLFAQNIVASGSIQSSNYEAGVSGMKLMMSTGAWDSKYFKIDDLGKITATGGTIGGFTIGSNAIYKGTNSKSSTTAGIYLGTDAVRVYKSVNAYTHIENGVLTCVGANIKGDIYCNGSLYMYSPTYGRSFELLSVEFASDTDIIRFKTSDGTPIIYCDIANGTTISANYINTEDIYVKGTIISGGGNANIGYSTNPFGMIFASNWFRSTGKTGWYNQDYGGGIYMTDTTWVRVSHNKQFLVNNTLRANGEVQTTAANSYRMVYGNYGTFWRNDGGNLWLLFTNSGDQYGGYNSLRPFYVNLSSGSVTLGNGCSVNGNIYATGKVTGNGGVYWGSERCVYGRNNTVQWLNNPGGNYMEVNCNNGTTYGVTWFVSDARLKKDIEETPVTALDYIKKIEHKQFGWIDEERRSIRCGYVAQQLEGVGLDVVYRIKQPEDSQLDELYQIDGTRLLPYITKAMQELCQIIQEQAAEIQILKQSVQGGNKNESKNGTSS